MTSHPLVHKVGMGLRSAHFPFLEERPETHVAWFEALTENYIDSLGRPWEMLASIRQDYPVSLHGVSMNLGSVDGVRRDYLEKLKSLIERVEPFIVSDHICWTGSSHSNLHDLLPLPYMKESLNVLTENIDDVQSFLHRPLVLENISSYVRFRDSEMSEAEFLNELSSRTGCMLLLDVTNLHVNSVNHGLAPERFLRELNFDRIAQIHLAGPQQQEKFLFDAHSEDIPEEVWNLFRAIAPRVNHLPVSIERDDNVPDFRELELEVLKTALILEKSHESERHAVTL